MGRVQKTYKRVKINKIIKLEYCLISELSSFFLHNSQMIYVRWKGPWSMYHHWSTFKIFEEGVPWIQILCSIYLLTSNLSQFTILLLFSFSHTLCTPDNFETYPTGSLWSDISFKNFFYTSFLYSVSRWSSSVVGPVVILSHPPLQPSVSIYPFLQPLDYLSF